MANPINSTPSGVLLSTAQKPSGRQSVDGAVAQAETRKGPENRADKVSMTPEATRLQKIEEQLAAVPAVDSAKVAEIKAAIANGSFVVDTQAIAGKIIAFESGK